ncbi:MAG: hypothetical protein ACJAXX_002897 [Roseivirga sp.]|jgi:hypothetical protein
MTLLIYLKKSISRRLAIALLFLISLVYQGRAQATDATIQGVVNSGIEGTLPAATVILRNTATGFQTGTITNAKGEYRFIQVPLGGPYELTSSFAGYGAQRKEGFMVNQGDQLKINFSLEESVTTMETIVVTGEKIRSSIDRQGEGILIDAKQIQNLPSEGRNFTNLVSLSPLQGGGSINLGGQRRSSTNVIIDGMNARNTLTAGEIGRGPYTISQEAIRTFEVATNDYDVTQGRQGGGAIKAVTKSGTNELQGSAFLFHRNEQLQNDLDIRENPRDAEFNNSQYGFSLGGPIVKDKIHFFTVYEQQDATDPLFIADIQTADDENRLGITQNNLDRFLQIARGKYGVSNDQQLGQFDRTSKANTFFARIDWQLNNTHLLTIRNNYNKWFRPFNTSDNSNVELAESWSDFESQENTLGVSLRSAFNSNFTNEFKVQYQYAERAFKPSSQLPSSNIPRAIVNVQSLLPNGTNQNRTVQLGGQRFTPETNLEKMIQFTNTSYLSKGNVNFTFGTDNMITYLETLLSNEQNGRFFFDSLDDFDNLLPSRFAREVPLQGLPVVKQTVLDLSLFAQAEFNVHPNVEVVAGLRWDGTIFTEAAEFNETVFNELGIRTDNRPQDLDNIQPRLQAIWNIGGKDSDILKIGGGIFNSQPHYYAQVNNIQNSGTRIGAIDVTGADVPTPDFNAYRQDPSTVPGVPEGQAPFSTINAVSGDFEVPTIAKFNIDYTHYFGNKYSISINYLASKTTNNYVYQESNLVEQPYFVTEEGREVFVPANTITAGGITDWTKSRISNQVGRALVLESVGEVDQHALIISGAAQIGKEGYVSMSYTRNSSRDNSSYNCCVANTSTFLPVTGDPRDLNYGYSDNNFRSKFVLNTATPTFYGFVLGATITGSGGSPFNFVVDNNNRSANGDFNLSNDQAYIFDPNDAGTPAAIRDGYLEILNNSEVPQSFKDYLQNNFGQFAERNAGVNGFYANVDLRLIKKVKITKDHGLEFSADLFNFANFLDSSKGNSHEYGRNRELMRITGFDQGSQSYDYSVQTGSANEPISGTPWRLQLGVRYTFGQ